MHAHASRRLRAFALVETLPLTPAPASASSRIIADRIGRGVGRVLKGCADDSRVGW